MSLTKKQRAALREMFGGKCAYCGCDLPANGWHADHVKPVLRKFVYVNGDSHRGGHMKATGEFYAPENNHADNYYPSCAACNIEKSSGSVEDFRHGLERKVEVLRKGNTNFKHLERYGMIAIVQPKVIFYFETNFGEVA